MKIQYLGTAAAEGIPAVFCECPTCREAAKRGGREIRTRHQVMIDDRLLLDFPPDTYMHKLMNGLDLSHLGGIFISHAHSDHLYTEEIEMFDNWMAHINNREVLGVYGPDAVIEKILSIYNRDPKVISFNRVEAFKSVKAGGYTVTPLVAQHSDLKGVIYIVSDGERTMLYGHDTDYFPENTWEYLAENGVHFDLVSLDCTEACKEKLDYVGHMTLNKNAEVKSRLIEQGNADGKTVFVCSHFSHNGSGVLYKEFSEEAEKLGFLTSYDSMVVEI